MFTELQPAPMCALLLESRVSGLASLRLTSSVVCLEMRALLWSGHLLPMCTSRPKTRALNDRQVPLYFRTFPSLKLPIEIYDKILGKCIDSFKRIFGQSTLHGVHIPVRDVDDCLNLCRQVSFNRKNVRSHSSHEC